MADFQKYARLTRSVSVAHGEAFQLMLYRADDGSKAWFWNSRDGVTPFGTSIAGKEYRHAMHGYPTGYYGMLPDAAEWVWVSHTPTTWEAMQREIDARYRARGDQWGQDFCERFPTPDDWLAVSPFEHGQPHQITRAEFVAGTPEWMGGPQADAPETPTPATKEHTQ